MTLARICHREEMSSGVTLGREQRSLADSRESLSSANCLRGKLRTRARARARAANQTRGIVDREKTPRKLRRRHVVARRCGKTRHSRRKKEKERERERGREQFPSSLLPASPRIYPGSRRAYPCHHHVLAPRVRASVHTSVKKKPTTWEIARIQIAVDLLDRLFRLDDDDDDNDDDDDDASRVAK